MISQFTGNELNLSSYIHESGYYAAGRLDKDSEGLLLLTNDGLLQSRITHPRFKMTKVYLVQLEGKITEEALTELRSGVMLADGKTRIAAANIIDTPNLPTRSPPIRSRVQIPTSWIKLSIKEGRNRQVRRMTAAIGFPTLRLFRSSIGPWRIDNLEPGEYRWEHVNLPYH